MDTDGCPQRAGVPYVGPRPLPRMSKGTSVQGEDLYVAGEDGCRWQGLPAGWSGASHVGRTARVHRKLSVIVVLLMLLSGTGVVTSWAANTSTDLNTMAGTGFVSITAYFADTTTGAGNSSGASFFMPNFTDTHPLWPNTPNYTLDSATQVNYIGVETTDRFAAHTITLTLADDGGAQDANVDITVKSGTCSNNAGTATLFPAVMGGGTATMDNDCNGTTGIFTPLTTGGTVFATNTFAANNGTSGLLDVCGTVGPVSGACTPTGTTWPINTLDKAVFQITVTPLAAAAPGTYTDTLTWTSTG